MITYLLGLIFATNSFVISPTADLMAKHEAIINQLIQCESGDRDITNHDDGGSPSYSYLQFKKATWDAYVKKYNLFREADEVDRENLMHDRWANRLVASYILEEKDGWKNWKICAKKISPEI